MARKPARTPFHADCVLCRQARDQGIPRWHLYHFTDAMEAALIAASREGYAAVRTLRQTDPLFQRIPYYVIRRRGRQIGVPRGAFIGTWDAAEDAVFTEHSGQTYTLEKWQRLLKRRGFHRSLQAIRCRLLAQGWSARQGEWTLADVAKGFGVIQPTVAKWADSGFLKTTYASAGKQCIRYTSTPDLCRMLALHPELAVKGKPDVLWLVSLFTMQAIGTTKDLTDESFDDDGTWMTGAMPQLTPEFDDGWVWWAAAMPRHTQEED